MHNFYYNSELTEGFDNVTVLIRLLSNSLKEFNTLLQKDLKVNPHIITEKIPSEIKITKEESLAQALEKIENTALKRLAYRWFNTYPIDEYLQKDISEKQLEEECFYNRPPKKISVFYSAIIAKLDLLYFTVPVYKDLKNNFLEIECAKYNSKIFNLYGYNDNTRFIEALLRERNAKVKSEYERFLYELNQPEIYPNFKKEYQELSKAEKESVLNHVEKSKKAATETILVIDNKLNKDVSRNDSDIKIYEMRIYRPTAVRIYFTEVQKKIYIASVGKKSNPNQNKDIKKAESILKQMLLTRN